MPTKSLQLDGPDLEELLARAMSQAGPGGRVASADRVRRGGVAGFFAREHFEVVIEFDDDKGEGASGRAAASGPQDSATAADHGAATVTARSWSELVDVTEDVLEISGTSSDAGAGTAAGSGTAPDSDIPASTPSALGSEARMPSTQKASFAAMLSAIARETVTSDGAVANTVNTTPEAGAMDEADGAVAATPPWAITAGGSLTGAWIDAIAAAAPRHASGPQHATGPAPTSAPVLAADLFTDTSAQAVDARSLVQPGLAALGLPDGLLPESTVLTCLEALSNSEDAQTYIEVALTSALQQLPEAPLPPHRAGGLLVLAGELDRALECAALLADRQGIDLDTVVVASQARHRRGVAACHLVASPEEAADLAVRSRRLPHPLLVAMHAPVSAEPDRWATRMLAALAPTAVWGVAPATHKSEDLAAWADSLGGLDALALEDLSATTSPADVLAAGIPVASLDGRQATPALWAALIAARLLLAHVAGRHSSGAIRGA